MSIDLSIWQGLILAGAGFISGALNAAAGGGTLISFPVLIATGYPPLTANVTNNVAAFPGYVGGAWGYRHGLGGQRKRIASLTAASVVGSLIGVGLILASSQTTFEGIVPFLVLAACGLLAIEPYLGRFLGERRDQNARPGVGAFLAQMFAATYGGYFGAALGVAVLALLNLTLDDTLQRLNALKAFLQMVIGGVAALGFAVLTPVAWLAVAVIAPASIVGGQVGARLAQRVSDRVLRISIIVYGIAAAAWLFFQ
jgi:uncharacterized membrane protein YfcA